MSTVFHLKYHNMVREEEILAFPNLYRLVSIISDDYIKSWTLGFCLLQVEKGKKGNKIRIKVREITEIDSTFTLSSAKLPFAVTVIYRFTYFSSLSTLLTLQNKDGKWDRERMNTTAIFCKTELSSTQKTNWGKETN